ncbi:MULTISPECIES: DDE-type integrase/transposase/recombinase [unclassified Bacillus (in: firmicutes)]|uniref:DDE-type integrase/transposase/recombinase n=1 Tax=unclassified Bacillus (in: firmicutes) TaxID=185979 RepID=UPI0033658445
MFSKSTIWAKTPNNEIVAWKLSHRNDLQLVLEILDLAIQKRDVYGTIIHSDQGCQYTSHAYHRRLQQLGAIGKPLSQRKLP